MRNKDTIEGAIKGARGQYEEQVDNRRSNWRGKGTIRGARRQYEEQEDNRRSK